MVLKWKVIILVFLLAAIESCSSLSEGEKQAISAMIRDWPVLVNLTPSWDPNHVENACVDHFEGLQCVNIPQESIVGMYVPFHRFVKSCVLPAPHMLSLLTHSVIVLEISIEYR